MQLSQLMPNLAQKNDQAKNTTYLEKVIVQSAKEPLGG